MLIFREYFVERIVFLGTPEFAVPTLLEIIGQGHEVVACYTQPPRPAGRRGLEIKKSPVHEKAITFGIPVNTPVSFKEKGEKEKFIEYQAEVAIVVAYGLILPLEILESPQLGCFNLHPSLLPRWRGAAPINRAIMTGDTETGVAVMKMDTGLDTGAICLEEKITIDSNMTAGALHDSLATLGSNLMVRALSALERGTLTETPQSEVGITYADKISKSEAQVDWTRSASEVHHQIHGLSPFPGAWCEMVFEGKVERVKIFRSKIVELNGESGQLIDRDLTVACGTGAVQLLELQKAGKKVMSNEEFMRGSKLKVGTNLAINS